MQALASIQPGYMREPTARCVIPRQAARTMAGEGTQLHTAANIPAQRMPITATAITRTGGVATDMAFTSRTENSGAPSGSLIGL